MKISIATLFPQMFDSVLESSILARAIKNGLIDISLFNIRDYTKNKHNAVDDYPFGGGDGMLMQAQPIYDCLKDISKKHSKDNTVSIYMSPAGKKFDDKMSKELAGKDLIILCGHYEGIDERAIEECVDMQVSIGDYVLTGGELPAMVLIDAVIRHIPGVLGSEGSSKDESFTKGLLEYPQYTRPEMIFDKKVPEVLLSGNHGKIEDYRLVKSFEKTMLYRPELLKECVFTKRQLKKILKNYL